MAILEGRKSKLSREIALGHSRGNCNICVKNENHIVGFAGWGLLAAIYSVHVQSSFCTSLTNLAPLGSDAVVEAEVVDLAVAVFYVQLGEAEVDPAAAGHADLPLTHRVVRVCPRVTQRGQSPTAGAKYTGATAITCRTTQSVSGGGKGASNKAWRGWKCEDKPKLKVYGTNYHQKYRSAVHWPFI